VKLYAADFKPLYDEVPNPNPNPNLTNPNPTPNWRRRNVLTMRRIRSHGQRLWLLDARAGQNRQNRKTIILRR